MNATSASCKVAGTVAALVLAIAPAHAARDGNYLRAVGPAPLRIEAAPERVATFTKPANHAPEAVASPAANSTNAAPEISVQAPVPNSATNNAFAEAVAIGNPVAPAVIRTSDASSDMMLVTPQMLAEYLKPGTGATNANTISVFVPAPVNFVPPVETNVPQSRATYRVQ